jgi:hypothetical protein
MKDKRMTMDSNPNPKPQDPATSKPTTDVPAPPSAAQGFFVDYFETAKAVCLSPMQFFEYMPREGGFRGPTIFLAVGAGVCALEQVIFYHSFLAALSNWLLTQLVILLMARGIVWIFAQFGGRGGFEETYRVMCFSSPPMVLMGIPWVSTLAVLWMAVLWVLGLKKINGF